MTGCYQPIPYAGMNKPPGKHFPAHVIGYAHQRHDAQNQRQHADVHGYEKHQRGDHDGTGQGLDRVETHCGPRGGWAAGMVYGMGDAEPLGPVHPAMCPVEPGVMREEVEEQRKRQVPQRVGGQIGVDHRPPPFLPAPGHYSCRHAVNRCRYKRPAHFPANLQRQAAVKAGPNHARSKGKTAAGKQVAQGHDCRHGKGGKGNGEKHPLRFMPYHSAAGERVARRRRDGLDFSPPDRHPNCCNEGLPRQAGGAARCGPDALPPRAFAQRPADGWGQDVRSLRHTRQPRSRRSIPV